MVIVLTPPDVPCDCCAGGCTASGVLRNRSGGAVVALVLSATKASRELPLSFSFESTSCDVCEPRRDADADAAAASGGVAEAVDDDESEVEVGSDLAAAAGDGVSAGESECASGAPGVDIVCAIASRSSSAPSASRFRRKQLRTKHAQITSVCNQSGSTSAPAPPGSLCYTRATKHTFRSHIQLNR